MLRDLILISGLNRKNIKKSILNRRIKTKKNDMKSKTKKTVLSGIHLINSYIIKVW